MNPIQKAVDRAIDHIQKGMTSQAEIELRNKLKELDKDQLIEEIIDLQLGKKRVKIKDIVYNILEDPECAWLTFDTIATIINKHIPGSKTTANSLRWYPSAGSKDGKKIINRKPEKEILAELTNLK